MEDDTDNGWDGPAAGVVALTPLLRGCHDKRACIRPEE